MNRSFLYGIAKIISNFRGISVFSCHFVRSIMMLTIAHNHIPRATNPLQSATFIALLFFGFEVAVDDAEGKVVVVVVVVLKQLVESTSVAG